MTTIHRQSEYMPSSGNRLHLDIRRHEDDRPALLFIPGTGAHAAYYDAFLERLAKERFTVVGLDLRGHGKSEGKRGDFSFDELLDDVDAAVSYIAENITKNIGVFGSSQGGLLTLYAAVRNDAIRSALCHNAAYLPRDAADCTRAPGLFSKTMPLFVLFSRMFPSLRLPTTIYLDMHAVFRDEKNLRAYLDDPLSVKRYSLRSIASLATAKPARPLSEIPCPVMILTGSEDAVIPLEVARRVYEDLTPPRELEVIEGALHMLLIEYIDETLPIVSRWFQDTLGKA